MTPLVIGAGVVCWLVVAEYYWRLIKRRRIMRRSKSYVDPKLVSWVLQHPEQAKLQPQTADVTVVMTNLADSVGLYERLGDVPAAELINLYMGTMVPIIRRNQGYLNKFLGDKIFIIFNAPVASDSDHPARAIETVLQMQIALDELNEKLAHVGKPRLQMRAGISSGMATVGDIGTATASDYTVFGEVADRAKTLEQSCKQAGTRNLTSVETASRVGDRFTLRAIKLPPDATTPIFAYEAIARAPTVSTP
jgi:adenylate cyclase